MRDAGESYEYVCSYVDDLTAIMKDPKAFFDELEKRGFGLKGVTDKPDVFLGGSVGRDQDGTLWWGAKRYIARCLETYERAMGEKPKPCNVPIPEKSQPELDDSDELDEKGRNVYQSLIGCLQWVVTLGRFDIACAVMTMSRFRVAPRKGHLALLGNVFGYLHCKVTGRSAMGGVFMVQETIVGHFSRRQSTVETATYASEFIAGRAALDEALAIRYELRMLGAPLDGPIWMFGDNKSMIDSAAEPAGRLTKRHLILSWHRLREKAAMGIVHFLHIGSNENIADCLTKHLAHAPMWALIKEHLFYRYNDGNEVEVVNASHAVHKAPDGEYQAGNSIGPEDGGHIHKGCWYVEVIGKCPYFVQRSQAYVQAYAKKVVFWHKKTG
jgi:hypothetical protein